MSASDILKLYYDRFAKLPDGPNQLLSFSRQACAMPSLKWIEARSILNNKEFCTRLKSKSSSNKPALKQGLSADLEHIMIDIDCSKSIAHLASQSFAMSTFKPQQFRVAVTPPILSPLIDHSPLQTLTLPATLDSFPYIRGLLPRSGIIDELQSLKFTHSETDNDKVNEYTPPAATVTASASNTSVTIKGETVQPPPNMIAIPHASDSEGSIYDRDVQNSLSNNDELLYNKYSSKYDDDDYNNMFPFTDSTSFDSHHDALPAHETSSDNESNNNVDNREDKEDSGCPVYHEQDIYSEQERNVFNIFKNKLMEMDDFTRDYMDLRTNYLVQQCKVEKNRQVNLKRTKQKISECFNEIYVLLKEKENALLYEVDEMFNEQTVINNTQDVSEKNTNNEVQTLLSEHMTYIAHQITLYQNMMNASNLKERNEGIVKLAEDTQTEHRSRIQYFNSMYDQMKHNLESLNDEHHIDFVLNENTHFDSCNFLRCAEFGSVIANIPKPGINHIQILGNDVLNMELSENMAICSKSYAILLYQISYCYHSTIHVENIDEKQDKMQWENVEIDCCQQHNVYLIEFEIDDLNLVNADLIIKIRYFLRDEGENMKIWSGWSDIYQLTQSDLYKSMSNIVACLDDDDDLSSSSSKQQILPNVNIVIDGENDNDCDTVISPLFTMKQTECELRTECNTPQTVCYKEEFEEEINIECTPDSDCNTVHERSDCTIDEDEDTDTDEEDEDEDDTHRGTDEIDLLKFQKDLYFDQNEIEMQMTQNQQLIQQFMKGISSASKVNNELIKSCKDVYKQKELWMNNKCHVLNIKKRKSKIPLLSTANSWMKNNKHSVCKSSSSLSLTKSSGNLSSTSTESYRFTHSFNASLPGSFDSNAKRPSITQSIVKKISKIGHKISKRSSNNKHSPTDIEHEIAWNQRLSIYGELCHILQENPAYLSRLTRLIQVRDIPIWCRTIVCDLFGNESDTRNEHLLLRIFECILKDYCADAKDMDLFLRGDNIITRMMSCFMNDRCVDNIKTLQFIFERPMKELIFDNEQQLNLEIDPVKVYTEMASSIGEMDHHMTQSTIISDSMDSDNSNPMLKVDSLNSDSLQTCEFDENVKAIIARRIEQIQVIVAFFLDRMSENARVIPFGIRWLCKMVAINAKVAFPEATRFELNTLIGKVIYLRYFEPALSAPYEFLHLMGSVTKNEVIQNNFDIVCQVLRSILCNERFTNNICNTDTTLLHWIKQQQLERVPVFYEKLLDLPHTELKDRLNVDNYLISCKNDLELSLKQIYLLHSELYRNQEIWSNDYNHNIPLFDVLDRLEGDAPFQYEYDKERMVLLDLTVIETSFNPFFVDDNIDSNSEYSLHSLNDHTDSGFVNVQYNANNSYDDEGISEMDLEHEHASELKCDDEQLLSNDESYIYNILFSIKYKDDDIMGIRHSLRELLIHKNIPQFIVNDYRHSFKTFLDELRNWCAIHDKEIMLSLIDSILERMDAYRLKHNINCGYNSFVFGYHRDINKIVHFSKRLQLKAMTFAKARDAMIDHTNYLENKLSEYKQLLQQETAMIKSCKVIKISYKNLLNQNVIIEDDDNLKMNRHHFVFRFVHQSMDCFQVQIISKAKGKSKNADENESCLKPATLSLLKLLEMRDANRSQFYIDTFPFFIDTTIHLLNGIIANKV